MTLEEKIAHLQASSMEEARAEGNAIIDNYRDALENVLKDHKEEVTAAGGNPYQSGKNQRKASTESGRCQSPVGIKAQNRQNTGRIKRQNF